MGVIGGADGPTAIFVAGNNLLLLGGGLLLAALLVGGLIFAVAKRHSD